MSFWAMAFFAERIQIRAMKMFFIQIRIKSQESRVKIKAHLLYYLEDQLTRTRASNLFNFEVLVLILDS